MSKWLNLVGNKKAKEIYEIIRKIHYENKSTDEMKKRVNELSDELNKDGFTDTEIEQYVDWVDMNRNLGNNISNL